MSTAKITHFDLTRGGGGGGGSYGHMQMLLKNSRMSGDLECFGAPVMSL